LQCIILPIDFLLLLHNVMNLRAIAEEVKSECIQIVPSANIAHVLYTGCVVKIIAKFVAHLVIQDLVVNLLTMA